MAGIGFNTIPSNLVAPIFTFETNSGGQFEDQNRLILTGYKLAAGTVAANTPTPCPSLNDAALLAGAGSMLYEMVRVAAANYPGTVPYINAVAEPAGVNGTWTITLASIASLSGTGSIEIAGRALQVAIATSDTPTTVAAALAAAVNAYADTLTGAMLPVTAASAAAVVTLTARHKGDYLNDLDIYVPPTSSNLLAGTGVTTVAVGVAGSGTPAVSAALATINDDPADTLVSPFPDATNLASYTAWSNDISGRWAWNRQVYGHVWTVHTGTYSAATTLGLTLNDRHLTVLRRLAATPSPAYEWIAAFAAAQSAWLFDCILGNVSRNQTGRPVLGVRAPRDRSTFDNYAARDGLLKSGLSTFQVGADGTVQIDKSITTYRTGATGQVDTVFRDVNSVYQVAGAWKYMRAKLLAEHGQKAIVDSNPGALDALTTLADIKASWLDGMRMLAKRGVVENVDAAMKKFAIARDTQNPARVNIMGPVDRVSPLDILATNGKIYTLLPAA